MSWGPWTPEQEQALERYPLMAASELKPRIDRLGPSRSTAAIVSKRREMPRQREMSGRARMQSERVRSIRSGWPNTPGGPVKQDRRYMARLLDDFANWPGDADQKAATAKRLNDALVATFARAEAET